MQNAAYLFVGFLFMGTLVASCSHEDPIDCSPQLSEKAIQFAVAQEDDFVDVQQVTTKATELTTGNIPHFGVFAAYLASGTYDAAATKPAPNYMYNQKVAKNGTTWECTPTQYWPIRGSLSFFAYAPYCNDDKLITFSSSTQAGAPTLTYTTPQDVTSQLDLLAAAPLYDQALRTTSLSVSFKHLLSSIEFSASKDASLASIVKIQEITITGLKTKATYSYPTTGTGAGSWTLDAASPASNYALSIAKGQLTDTELATTATKISSTDLVMPLPQAVPTGTVTLSAKISYNISGVIQTRTVTRDLNPTISNLQMAKKYKVTLSIGAAAPTTVNIKLDCTVADWTIKNIAIPPFE